MAEKRLALLDSMPLLEISDDVGGLADAILSSGAMPHKAATDAAHVAVATVHGVHYLITWNCRHIANAEMTALLRKVCMSEGYECPIICTPEELMGGE